MTPPPADGAAARATAPLVAPQGSPRAARPRLRVAAVAEDRRSAVSLLGSVLLVLVFLSVLGVVIFQALLVQTQTRIDDLEDQVVVEQERARELRLDLAELRSPERIVATARERLGMIEPAEVLYLEHDDADDAAASLDPAPAADPTTSGGGG